MFENLISERPQRPPLLSFLLILIVVALGFLIIGPMVGFLFALPFYDGSMMEMATAFESPTADESLKLPLFIMQGFATFVGLILGPAWFLSTEGKSIRNILQSQNGNTFLFTLTIILVIVFMAVNSVFIEWNSSVTFPDFAKDFERWAREREDMATEITTFLTRFDTPWQLLLAVFVVAVLPAIGEELVFRGIIQNQLLAATKNIHIAIWLSAFLFSAIHFQFFGFVPRLLLGALFGYLYFWSGNLWYAIIAHFANNGISVLAMYFHQKGVISVDLETPQSAPLDVFIVSLLITAGLLYYFYHYFNSRKFPNETL